MMIRFSFTLSAPLFIAIFAVLLLSCRKKDTIEPVIYRPPIDTISTSPIDTGLSNTDTSAKTFLALGDSYTIGQSVDSSERFPAQTAALLAEQNIVVTQIKYIAATGWTTINLKNAIELENPKGPYDIVTLLIGVNDQYQSNDTTGYRSRFADLLNTAISLAAGKTHVFVVSIPDWGVTPFGSGRTGVSAQIDLFNKINREVTDGYGISYTDVTTISRNDAGDNLMLANDNLHPSGKQYAQWSKVLEPSIYNALK